MKRKITGVLLSLGLIVLSPKVTSSPVIFFLMCGAFLFALPPRPVGLGGLSWLDQL